MSWISGLVSVVGSGITNFFGFKGKQADVIQESIKVVNDVNSTAEARDLAAARVLVAEANSESWITRSWRPLFMVTFMIMLLSYWFGYVPPQLLGDMPPIIAEIFDIIKIGIMGYIPSRGIEKIVKEFKVGKVIQKFVEKRLG